MKIYVIYDVVAQQGSNLFEAKNDAVALRQFNRLVKDSDFAQEFKLWYVGEYTAEEDPEIRSPIHCVMQPRQVVLNIENSFEEEEEA